MLSESVSSLNNRGDELPIDDESCDAALVAMGRKRDLIKEFLAAKETKLEKFWLTVGALSDYVELL